MSSLVLDMSLVMHTVLDFGEIWCGSIDLSGRWASSGVGESTVGKYLSEKRR